MPKIVAVLILPALLAGCTSSAVTQRLDSLESDLAEVRQMAADATSDAQAAQAAGQTAAEARRLAQQALDAARAAAERAERIGSECCVKK